VQDGNH